MARLLEQCQHSPVVRRLNPSPGVRYIQEDREHCPLKKMSVSIRWQGIALRSSLLVAALLVALRTTQAFVSPASLRNGRYDRPLGYSSTAAEDLLSRIRSMKVQEIKQELLSLQKPTNDIFEKDELVRRLFEAIHGRISKPKKATSTPKEFIQGPLFLSGYHDNVNGGGLTYNPAEHRYATIQVRVHDSPTDYTLNLLLDTACSGFVLRSEVARKFNMPPGTITGPGGTRAVAGVAQIGSFSFGGERFGPMPATVQAIEGLPPYLDGIIGLSFLNQFACVELDFQQGVVTLFKDQPYTRNDLCVTGESGMSVVPGLGMYAAKVSLDGRGPVSMLVDTGATTTILDWKGVSDLGLARHSAQLTKIPTMGAMPSDKVAIRLTHQLTVERELTLGASNAFRGGVSVRDPWSIHIGQFPSIDGMTGIGGILGMDALIKCPVVRFSGRDKRMTLYSAYN